MVNYHVKVTYIDASGKQKTIEYNEIQEATVIGITCKWLYLGEITEIKINTINEN